MFHSRPAGSEKSVVRDTSVCSPDTSYDGSSVCLESALSSWSRGWPSSPHPSLCLCIRGSVLPGPSATEHSLLRNVSDFLRQMCHFAVFPTRSCIAVSVVQCPGVVTVGNDVELLSSHAGIHFPGWVQVDHSLLRQWVEKVCASASEMNRFRRSLGAVTDLFQKVQ